MYSEMFLLAQCTAVIYTGLSHTNAKLVFINGCVTRLFDYKHKKGINGVYKEEMQNKNKKIRRKITKKKALASERITLWLYY